MVNVYEPLSAIGEWGDCVIKVLEWSLPERTFAFEARRKHGDVCMASLSGWDIQGVRL